MGTGQGAHFTSSGLSVNGLSSSGVNWTLAPVYTGTPVAARPGALPVPDTECRKHRLGALELVGDDVEGVCLGCGCRVIVPSMPETGKTLMRALALEERLMALQGLAESARRRAMTDMLPEFAELAALVEFCRNDLVAVDMLMRILRAQLAALMPAE